ncbi:hypothetical protein MKX01_014746 [Papaver californicum]|nr:hypothetical protein MKX01_014746 [Papaver californicum]
MKLYSLITILLLYLCISISVKAMLDPTDFLALQAIRKSLNDLPGSNFFSSWDFTSDPCNFSGVYCVSDRVVALNLGDPKAGSSGLTGHIHPSIGKLSLIELSIVPGRIIGTPPNTLNQLKNLRTIDLSYNQLTGLIPRRIGTFWSLNNLILCLIISPVRFHHFSQYLKHNKLTGSLYRWSFPSSLPLVIVSFILSLSLNRLNYLDLSMNQFTGRIPGNMFSFPIRVFSCKGICLQVQRLYMDHNKFSGQVPGSFLAGLMASNIQMLYLQHNYLNFVEQLSVFSINCMVPPINTTCPTSARMEKTRPAAQCGRR